MRKEKQTDFEDQYLDLLLAHLGVFLGPTLGPQGPLGCAAPVFLSVKKRKYVLLTLSYNASFVSGAVYASI